ncbi:MAG: DUF1190 domain-containing protein [Pelagimonas sp.]
MTKRSKHVAIAIIGAAAFTLAGCREEQVDAQAFPDLQSCTDAAERGGFFSAADCDAAFAEAEALHVEAAPRYDSQAVCEEQHGVGACGTEAAATQGGSGSIFMPLLAGYLMGNMLSGGRGTAASQPMYRTAGGKFSTAAGTSTFSSNKGAAKLGASTFAKPAATAGKPPMTRAAAQSRGGFGKSFGRSAGS